MKVYILRGAPASGKSTYANIFIKQAELESAVTISRDGIRDMLGGSFDKSLLDMYRAMFRSCINEAVKLGTHDIIIDQCALSNESVMNTYAAIREFSDCEIIIVNFYVKFSDAWQRNQRRKPHQIVPYSDMLSMHREYRAFEKERGSFSDAMVNVDEVYIASLSSCFEVCHHIDMALELTEEVAYECFSEGDRTKIVNKG